VVQAAASEPASTRRCHGLAVTGAFPVPVPAARACADRHLQQVLCRLRTLLGPPAELLHLSLNVYAGPETDGYNGYGGSGSGSGTDLGPGNGSTVLCADGSISHSGGIQGACSHHGGVSP
jgi:hypothetical protein